MYRKYHIWLWIYILYKGGRRKKTSWGRLSSQNTNFPIIDNSSPNIATSGVSKTMHLPFSVTVTIIFAVIGQLQYWLHKNREHYIIIPVEVRG